MNSQRPLLSIKLKNMVRKKASERDGYEPEFSLSNILVNGNKRGCSGFIGNPLNGTVVYVDTEPCAYGGITGYLYRYAKSVGNYSGHGRNHFTDEYDPEMLAADVVGFLRHAKGERSYDMNF